MSLTAEPVLEKQTSLGEGALWDDRTNRLLWVDINEKKLFVFNPADGSNREYDTGQMIGTVVPRASGGLIVALEDQIAVLDPETERMTPLIPVEQDLPTTRFNDGKCDPAGRFWAGTLNMEKGGKPGTFYRIDTDLAITPILEDVRTSNGLVWTRDNSLFYYIDTPEYRVDVFDYNLERGTISNRRIAFEIPREQGGPDGMTIDTENNLWVAHYGGGCVRCWDPETGRIIETIEVPGARSITSCAFGGPDRSTLYITTASQHMSEQELSEYPASGFLFAARTPARGRETFEFCG